jgi:hypothetical protein
VIVDRPVRESDNGTAINNIQIAVPNVALGVTYARFRYGYERLAQASPRGTALAGEVEDYRVTLAQTDKPQAVGDCYGDPPNNCPTIIRVNQPNNIVSYQLLDDLGRSVLGNDSGTIDAQGNVRPPRLDPATFLVTPPTKGTVAIANPPVVDSEGRQVLVYTPFPGQVGPDSFQYRVHDGAGNVSDPATVNIFITSANAIVVDDFVEVGRNSAAALLDPLDFRFDDLVDNDEWDKAVSPTAFIRSITRITPNMPAGEVATLAPAASNPRSFTFQPAPNFTGTVVYEYELDDNIPLTAHVRGRVTIQVGVLDGQGRTTPSPANATPPATPHYARLDVQILGLDGGAPNLHPGDEFLVRVTAEDLAGLNGPFAGRGANTRGVEAAYLDLLFDETIAAPVTSASNPLGYYIIFNGKPIPTAGGGTQVATGNVDTTVAPTQNAFTGAGALLSTENDFYKDKTVRFTSGALIGQQARITGYNGTTKRFILEPGATGALTQPPGNNDGFSIEDPLYNTQQLGELNFPLAGQIDEAGGTHTDTIGVFNEVGPGPQTVFTIRFQVQPGLNVQPGAPVQFQVIGDPADVDPATEIILTNQPNFANPNIPIEDEQVFIRGSSVVNVRNPADGEFSNFRNPLDVNDDDLITPADALIVINDLNAFGSRPLSQGDIALQGVIPGGYLDVNIDSHVAPVDALIIIDHLNFNGAGPATGSEFSGDGEAAGGAAASFASGTSGEQGEGEAAGLFLSLSDEEQGATGAVESGESADPLHEQFTGDSAVATSSSAGVVDANADDDDLELWDEASSQAADEICAELGKLLE